MKVSVIVPIYKVETFIERCASTLLEQTLKEVEYIFVDDASPDGSITKLQLVLKRYPERKNQVHLIRHPENLGLPAARNSGLEVATGEFIFHCDSDDFVDRNMLEQLYAKAMATGADIVWCDWWLSFSKNNRYMKQPAYATPLEALRGMLDGAMKYNVWNKLVRRSLYTDFEIRFPAGYGMGEDMTMLSLFVHAQRVAYLNQAFYYYVQQNTGAFSKTYSDRHLVELQHNVGETLAYLRKFRPDLELDYAFFKLNVKFPFLITDDRRKYRLWQEWYLEANPYIWQNRAISIRSRWLQCCAWRRQFWLVRLHYMLLYQVVYGLIFR